MGGYKKQPCFLANCYIMNFLVRLKISINTGTNKHTRIPGRQKPCSNRAKEVCKFKDKDPWFCLRLCPRVPILSTPSTICSICIIEIVCNDKKGENKQKEAGIGPFKKVIFSLNTKINGFNFSQKHKIHKNRSRTQYHK